MPSLRVVAVALTAVALAAAVVVWPQSGDIFDRLRIVLAPTGQGESAVRELQAKNFAGVEQMLASLPPGDPAQSARILSLEGAVLFLARDMRGARAKFDEAAKIRPLDDADSFTLAMALVNLNDGEGARTVLETLAHKHPEQSVYVYWLGKLDYDQRRYESAVVHLTKSTELDGNSPRAWDALALAYDMQGRMGEAQSAFEKAVNLNRTEAHPSPWPPGNYGYLLLRMNQAANAESLLRESLRYDARLAGTHYHLARTLEKEAKNEDAVDEYQRAVALDPTSTDAPYSLALLYRRLHRENDATVMFEEYRRRKQANGMPVEASPR